MLENRPVIGGADQHLLPFLNLAEQEAERYAVDY